MAQTLKFGNGNFATKAGSTLCYDDQNGNFKPIPMDFTRASTATRVNKQGLIEVVKSNVPRIDYTDTSDGVLLLEKAATNLIQYSEAFDNAYWTKGFNIATTPIVTPNQSVSPNGNITSDKIVFPIVGSGFSIITRPITVTNNHYSQSIYLKGELGNETIWLMNTKDGVNYYEIECNLSTQWQRFNYSALLTSGFDNIQFGIDTRSSTQSSNTIQTIYAWGAQLEQDSVASSYIPTQGSASTRVAETASGAGNSEVFSDSQGVLFADIAANANDGTNRQLTLSDGTTSNRVYFTYSTVGNQFSASIFSGGSLSFNANYTSTDLTNYHKILIKYKQNDFSLWVNGFKIATDTNGNTPSGLKNINLSSSGNSLPFYGSTKEIGYYNTALTDLELETLTSYKSWTSMVNELNLNIIYNG